MDCGPNLQIIFEVAALCNGTQDGVMGDKPKEHEKEKTRNKKLSGEGVSDLFY